jgi:hypothetical protein
LAAQSSKARLPLPHCRQTSTDWKPYWLLPARISGTLPQRRLETARGGLTAARVLQKRGFLWHFATVVALK